MIRKLQLELGDINALYKQRGALIIEGPNSVVMDLEKKIG